MGWNIGSAEYKKLRIWEGVWEKCKSKINFDDSKRAFDRESSN